MGLKTVTLQGRLVRDPETHKTKNDTEVCSFTVAVDSNRPSRGEEKPLSSFFRVSMWGKRGEACQRFLSKGDECVVTGDLELDIYQAQDGKTHANMQVKANEVHFGRKRSTENKKDDQIQYAGVSAPQDREDATVF